MLRERIEDPAPAARRRQRGEPRRAGRAVGGRGDRHQRLHVRSGEIGVGGGLVLGGELFRGYRGFGGEFGHTTVEPDGLPCACGSRGCLETRAGLEPLLAAAGLNGEAVHSRGSGKPVAELVRRAQEHDATALAALADCGRWLGVALGHRREPAVPAGDRARRPLRADDRVARAGDRGRALHARAGRQRRRAAGADLLAGRGGRDARRRRHPAAPRARGPDARRPRSPGD